MLLVSPTIRVRCLVPGCRRAACLLLFLANLVAVGAISSNGAENDDPAPAVVGHIASSVFRRYTPGQWGQLDVTMTNPTDQLVEGLVEVSPASEPQLQFSRRFLVPPHARRQVPLPILIPANLPPPADSLELVGRLSTRQGTGQTLIRPQGELMFRTMQILIDRGTLKTALLLPPTFALRNPVTNYRSEKAHELVVKTRQAFELPTSTTALHDDSLPSDPHLLRSTHQIVLASDRIASDSAGLRSLRQWLVRGGHLWIMLDMTSHDTVQQLLGDGFDYEVLDRVQLSDVAWETASPLVESPPSPPRPFDFPVEMVRIVTSHGQVTSHVQGWPASISIPFGDGNVFVTTLEARAWFEQPTGRIVPELSHVAGDFFAMSKTPLLDPQPFQAGLDEQIGYRIPSRTTVVGIFGGSSILLVAGALLLARRGRTEWFAVWGPVVCLSAGGLFYLLGVGNNTQLSPTAAFGQIGVYSEESGDLSLDGVAALYLPDAGPLRLRGEDGGMIWPDMTGLEGETKRIVWTGLDSWEWEALHLPPGVRYARSHSNVKLPEPARVTGHLGPRGLEGRFHGGSLTDPADAIVALPAAARLGVRLDADGAFAIGPDEVLAPGQFSLDALLSDEQRRRHDVYRALGEPPQASFPRRPSFLVWTAPLAGQINFSPLQVTGSMLCVLPLTIEETPVDTAFVVPSSFMTVRTLLDAEGRSLAFNPRTGVWTRALNSATKTRLHFRLPRQVLPCDVERARLSVKATVPSRDIDLVIRCADRDLPLKTLTNTNGITHIPIDDPEMLRLDADGGIQVGVLVSEPRDQQGGTPLPAEKDQIVTWTIDYVRLDVWGRKRASSEH